MNLESQVIGRYPNKPKTYFCCAVSNNVCELLLGSSLFKIRPTLIFVPGGNYIRQITKTTQNHVLIPPSDKLALNSKTTTKRP